MPLVEKHGGLWFDNARDSRTQPLFEQYDPVNDLLAIVVLSPLGHYIASVFEKVADPQWSLPVWRERRPQAIFATSDEAVQHSIALIPAALENP